MTTIVKWAKDRNILETGFKYEEDIKNILSEVFESAGITDDKLMDTVMNTLTPAYYANPNEHELIDSLIDTIIFCTNTLAKLGYNPTEVLKEAMKELNSRVQDPRQKYRWISEGKRPGEKWMKDKSAPTYKASYKECKWN